MLSTIIWSYGMHKYGVLWTTEKIKKEEERKVKFGMLLNHLGGVKIDQK